MHDTHKTTTRPLSYTRGGGGAEWQPGLLYLTHPHTRPHQKICPQEKNKIYQRDPKLEVNFRYTNFS